MPDFRGRDFSARPTTSSEPKSSAEQKRNTYFSQKPVKVTKDSSFDLQDIKVNEYPAFLIVTGTNSGQYYNPALRLYSANKLTGYIYERQYLLQIAKKYNFDMVKLVPEPENPFDQYAVKVEINFQDTPELGKGGYKHVGYVPAKPANKPGISNLTCYDVSQKLLTSSLWATGHITYIEGFETLGFRITIKDIAL